MSNFILFFVVYFIEGLIIWQYCNKVFETKKPEVVSLLIILFAYSVISPTCVFNNTFLNIFLFFAVTHIMILSLFKSSINTAFFHAALATVLMGLSELLFVGLVPGFAADFYLPENQFLYSIILACMSKPVYFLILFVFAKFLSHKKKDTIVDTKASLLLLGFPIISSCVMLSFFYICQKYVLTYKITVLVIVSTLLLLVSNIIIFGLYNYIQIKNNQNALFKLQLQRESDLSRYYKQLLAQDESQKILIHDIKKHLFSIKSINTSGTPKDVDAYIDTIIDSNDLTTFHRVSDNETVNSIVGRFQTICNNKNISLTTDIRSKSIDFMSDTDITSLLFNMFENAVEACDGMDDPEISLVICKKERSVYTLINMINSCKGNPFNEDGELKTTKQDPYKHGFGMRSIKRIVSKYNGEMNAYYGDDGNFHLTIIVDNT